MDLCDFCLNSEAVEQLRELRDNTTNNISAFEMLNVFRNLQFHSSNKICLSCTNNLTIGFNFYNQCLSVTNQKITEALETTEPTSSDKPSKDIIIKPEKRIYSCPHCSKRFRSFVSLKKHKDVHKILEQCEYCRTVFKSKYDVDVHIKSEHPKKRFKCIFCPKVKYNKLFYLLRHLESVHTVDSSASFCFACEEKSNAYSATDEVMSHIKNEHSLEMDKNDDLSLAMHEEFLDDFFLNDFDMWDDMNFSIDFDLTKLNSKEVSEIKHKCRYHCPECEEGFDHQKDLYIHSAEIHDKFSLLCRKCGEKFNRIENLKLHNEIHVSEVNSNDTSCRFCGKSFQSRKGLEYHCEVAHLDLQYECIYCLKVFSSAVNLSKHLNQKHSTLKMHLCSLCDREFTTLDHLKKHVESGHQKVKNFLCTKCGKTFSQLCHLKEHYNSPNCVRSK